MTNQSLATSYLAKATSRLKLLPLLLSDEDYSDVIREAQEIVELALKAMLRNQGIEPPKWHDVGPILLGHAERFPSGTRAHLQRLAEISKWLRREREMAFYGEIDFIPSEEYELDDARRASADAEFTVGKARELIGPAKA